MFSRYTAMSSSKVQDPVDHDNYPDPLAINYNNIVLSELPGRTAISKIDLDRFWVFMYKNYQGMSEADDVLLTLNDIPYLGMLEPGAYVYLPTAADLYSLTKITGVP